MTKREHQALPSWARLGRQGWSYRGQQRPPFAIEPGPGQESVWDYPRPPRLEPDGRRVEVRWHDQVIACTTRAVRVLETAHPPTFYLPRDDVRMELLERSGSGSHCEWKGVATDYDVRVGDELLASVAWSYEQPFADAEILRAISRSTPGASSAPWTASGCGRSRGDSTVAGSPATWSGRSRGSRAPAAGSRLAFASPRSSCRRACERA